MKVYEKNNQLYLRIGEVVVESTNSFERYLSFLRLRLFDGGDSNVMDRVTFRNQEYAVLSLLEYGKNGFEKCGNLDLR